jgi:hypothetical protein
MEMSNWVELLPMAAFTYNNSQTTTTSNSPFYANYGFHPNRGITQPRTDILPVTSKAYGHWMMAIYHNYHKILEKTRDTMKRYADNDGAEVPKYSTGDLVMFSSKHIRARCPCKRLDHKLYGPFDITEVLSGMAVRVNLPAK